MCIGKDRLNRGLTSLGMILFLAAYIVHNMRQGNIGIVDIVWKTMLVSALFSGVSILIDPKKFCSRGMVMYIAGCGVFVLAEFFHCTRIQDAMPFLVFFWAIAVVGKDRLRMLVWTLPMLAVLFFAGNPATLLLGMISAGLLLACLPSHKVWEKIIGIGGICTAVGGVIAAWVLFNHELTRLSGAGVCLLLGSLCVVTSIVGRIENIESRLPMICVVSASALLHAVTIIGGQFPYMSLLNLLVLATSIGFLLATEEEADESEEYCS